MLHYDQLPGSLNNDDMGSKTEFKFFNRYRIMNFSK